ncbi:unnamed protein product [Allacma fusca]|uniref:CRAL-TRIO domain-containing protein n=1 Tax=Allacma fusca TaxID=39272 RepID=A0A8J2L5F5_9HEXA|nr:unnamed protein product [Allacma fusca]
MRAQIVLIILVILNSAVSQIEDQETTTVIPTTDLPPPVTLTANRLPVEVHRKIYSYTKNAKAFKNMTFEETMAFMNDLDAWEAPREIRERVPYYLAGYDYDRRPVWMVEVGKIDFRGLIEQGENTIANLEKYLLQSEINVIKSLQAADTPGDEIREALYIYDMEDFTMKQISHLPTVAAAVRFGKKYSDLTVQFVGSIVIINSNYATKLAADIARPAVGRLMEKVEVYGTGRATWLPKLLKLFPMDVLPSWYGGNKNFKPLLLYG